MMAKDMKVDENAYGAAVDQRQKRHWYAMRVYYGRTRRLTEVMKAREMEYFDPSVVVSSLLFARGCRDEVVKMAWEHRGWCRLYTRPASDEPAAIADREMEVFRFVVTAGQEGLTYLGEDRPEYHQGDRVRVKEGPFKGAEGHIKRIKKDRRLVVTIKGVVAVATTYIHPDLLEKI